MRRAFITIVPRHTNSLRTIQLDLLTGAFAPVAPPWIRPCEQWCDNAIALDFTDLGYDYSFNAPLMVTFPCGVTSTPANISIIDDDALEETLTSFNVSVLSSDVMGLALDPVTTVSITDNESKEKLLSLAFRRSVL